MPKVLGIEEGSPDGTRELTENQGVFTRKASKKVCYYVLGDNTSQTEEDIEATTGLPKIGDALAGSVPTAYVKKVNPKEYTTVFKHPVTGVKAILYKVDIEYTSHDIEINDEATPLEDRTPKVKWTSEDEDEVLEKDAITGLPVQTVPGERLIVEHPACRPILEVRRYERYPFDPDVILSYVNHTNQNPFYGALSGCALMKSIETEEELISGVKYNLVTYKIKFNIKEETDEANSNFGNLIEDSWKARILHEGYKYFPGLGDPVAVFKDKHGTPTKTNLNAFGLRLLESLPPVYLEFNRFPKADFSVLNLGPFT